MQTYRGYQMLKHCLMKIAFLSVSIHCGTSFTRTHPTFPCKSFAQNQAQSKRNILIYTYAASLLSETFRVSGKCPFRQGHCIGCRFASSKHSLEKGAEICFHFTHISHSLEALFSTFSLAQATSHSNYLWQTLWNGLCLGEFSNHSPSLSTQPQLKSMLVSTAFCT